MKLLMTIEELKRILQDRFSDAEVEVWDLTGTSDHFHVEVTSREFEGLGLIQQHKLVHAACGEHLTTSIHALEIKTRTP